jgi:hypothetical protein
MEELPLPEEFSEDFAPTVGRSSSTPARLSQELVRSSPVETKVERDSILWITLSPIAIEVGIAPDGAPFETKIS